jgi:hypothetical protein
MTQGIFQAFQHAPWADIYDGHEWTWQAALDDMGLQVIEPEDEFEAQALTTRMASAAASLKDQFVTNVKNDTNEFLTGAKALPAEVWKRITKPPQEWNE